MKFFNTHPPHPALSEPAIQAVLQPLLGGVQATLGDRLVGMYLEGSLANGDFDADSDIDFVVVLSGEPDTVLFAALQELHHRLARIDSLWAIQLEGSYLSRRAIRAYDPAYTLYPNIERGPGERLKLAHHDRAWVVHRYILRERGLTLLGPPPQALIDPVSKEELRQAMLTVLEWAGGLLHAPEGIRGRDYQSYIVLTLGRVLYTWEHGEVVSKRAAAAWAQERFGAQWAGLIDRAWDGRRNPDAPLILRDLQLTLDMIRFALEQGTGYGSTPAIP
jgi:hypothetical protein